ncbi:sulfurtransferase [Roseovarius sp. LXJ103]|uniref:sulfurtransferase n=1 Tax=Roseovarius carneus TaxID=2853164 RepID=UPI000D60B3C6|nr:sulfurtransferase [Roseovarius carneus]MBZ8119581.1 sulfurtransferase [Roseovarius carneus]PWE34796.1 sulfurtransferase [Pelagicola sp. LXJ1103]
MTKFTRLIAAPALALALGLPTFGMAGTSIETTVQSSAVSAAKQTEPALYVTAQEAAQVLATREDVLLIDVRTPEETMLIGYPEAADVNIPFALLDPAHAYDEKKAGYKMSANPLFVDAVKTYLGDRIPGAILVMCRSGARSAKAVNALTQAGIEVPLYSVIDGFEGDKDDVGKRTVNGWKNTNAAWGTKIRQGYLQGVD